MTKSTILFSLQTITAVIGGAIVSNHIVYGCILIGISAGILAVRIKYDI